MTLHFSSYMFVICLLLIGVLKYVYEVHAAFIESIVYFSALLG
jgi:hypothetical protein